MSKEIYISILLLAHYGLLQAKLIDVHLGNPAEEMTIEREKQRLKDERDFEILVDENSSAEEKIEALDRLVQSGGMS